MTTRHELKCSLFFLDRIAVASPRWENGLTAFGIIKKKTNFYVVSSHNSKTVRLIFDHILYWMSVLVHSACFHHVWQQQKLEFTNWKMKRQHHSEQATNFTQWVHFPTCYVNDGTATERKISANLGYVTERGEGKIERARGEQDALCAIASPPSPYFGWLASNMYICNGQRSSEISCDKYKCVEPLCGSVGNSVRPMLQTGGQTSLVPYRWGYCVLWSNICNGRSSNLLGTTRMFTPVAQRVKFKVKLEQHRQQRW
jgi:hypothetical protein